MTTERTIQFGGTDDKDFADYIKYMTSIFHDLKMEIITSEGNSPHKYYIQGSLPLDHDADFIIGLVDGMMMEHKRMLNIQKEKND